MDMYQRRPNYKCDYCSEPIYKRPSELKNNKYHTCSTICQTKYCMKCPSKTYLMWLHWTCDMPQQDIATCFGIDRSIMKRYMDKYNIPTRTVSEDNKRRYTYMSDSNRKGIIWI